MASPSETLFHDIATPRSEGYPATQVIYDLVRHIGADVSSFRRNSQTSYRLVELARDLHDEINQRIRAVESSADPDWGMYDEYTEAIDPLEELLFGIVAVADEEHDEHLMTASSAVECKAAIDKWAKNRTSIRDCFRDLRNADSLKRLITAPKDDQGDTLHAATHDDRGFLNNLLTAIQDNTPNIGRQKTQAILREVTIDLESIQNLALGNSMKSIEEGLTTLSIKCAMIVYGVTNIIVEVQPSVEELNHYLSDKLWGAAKTLIKNVFGGLESQKHTLDELEAEYKKLEDILLGVSTIGTPESFRELVSYIGKIGRAYHAQSLVLVLLCREAVSYFLNNKTVQNRDALESAFGPTIDALKAATQLVANQAKNLASGTTNQADGNATAASPANDSHSPGSEPSADSMQSCTKLFEASINALKTCFEELGLDPTKPHQQLSKAQEKDKTRVEQVKEKLTQAAPTTGLVSITLNVHEDSQEGRLIKTLTCTVFPTARLSFVKWSAAKQVPEVDPSDPETSYFEKPRAANGDQSTATVTATVTATAIPLEGDVKSLCKEGETTCTLYLIVKKGEGVGKEATGEEATGEEATGEEATGEEATGGESTGEEATGEEATGEEATGGESAGGEASGGEAAGREAAGGEAAGGEAAGGEAAGGEASGGEATGEEAASGEAAAEKTVEEKGSEKLGGAFSPTTETH